MVSAVSFERLGPPFQFLPGSRVERSGQCRRLGGRPLQQIKSCPQGCGRLRQFRREALQGRAFAGQCVENAHGVGQAGKNLTGEDWLSL